MIHHLARAFFVRSQPALAPRTEPQGFMPHASQAAGAQPIRPRPLTPWRTTPQPAAPATPNTGSSGPSGAKRQAGAATRAVRITSDPSDARRTVIAGRFAEVCAALDRLVLEQEALA